jgi:hypothetical protein
MKTLKPCLALVALLAPSIARAATPAVCPLAVGTSCGSGVVCNGAAAVRESACYINTALYTSGATTPDRAARVFQIGAAHTKCWIGARVGGHAAGRPAGHGFCGAAPVRRRIGAEAPRCTAGRSAPVCCPAGAVGTDAATSM